MCTKLFNSNQFWCEEILRYKISRHQSAVRYKPLYISWLSSKQQLEMTKFRL